MFVHETGLDMGDVSMHVVTNKSNVIYFTLHTNSYNNSTEMVNENNCFYKESVTPLSMTVV